MYVWVIGPGLIPEGAHMKTLRATNFEVALCDWICSSFIYSSIKHYLCATEWDKHYLCAPKFKREMSFFDEHFPDFDMEFLGFAEENSIHPAINTTLTIISKIVVLEHSFVTRTRFNLSLVVTSSIQTPLQECVWKSCPLLRKKPALPNTERRGKGATSQSAIACW